MQTRSSRSIQKVEKEHIFGMDLLIGRQERDDHTARLVGRDGMIQILIQQKIQGDTNIAEGRESHSTYFVAVMVTVRPGSPVA
jgi:hypothetical protein